MTVQTKNFPPCSPSAKSGNCNTLIFKGFKAMLEVGSGPKRLPCHPSRPFSITTISSLSSLPTLPGGHWRPLAAKKNSPNFPPGRNEDNQKRDRMPTERIPEPNFSLKWRSKNEKGLPPERLIYMRVHYTNSAGELQRVKISTGKKCRPDHWDDGQMKVKAISSTLPFRDEVNARISEYREAAIEVYKVTGRDTPAADFRKKFYRYLEEQASEIARRAAKMDFAEFLDYYVLEVHQDNVNKHRCRRLLLMYRDDAGAPFSFNALTEQWAIWFKDWLYHAHRPAIDKKPLSKNYVSRVMETLRGFLKTAHEKGLHKNLDYTSEAFQAGKEESVKVALTPLEVEHFHHFDFGADTRLDKARNIFLASVYTGLRWSDITRLRARHIHQGPEGYVVSIANHKTGKVTTSPADPRLAEILERLGGQVPAMSNQKLNEFVKPAFRAAGISRDILTSKKPERWEPLHEVVTFHDSRITYATELYRQGYSVDEIRECMGHEKIETTRGYILKDEVDAIERVNRTMAARKRKEDDEGQLRARK